MINDEKLRIVDAHCHVPSIRYTPVSFIEASLRNRLAMMEATRFPRTLPQLLDRVLLQMQDHHADGLVGEMDKAGIDKTVLLCPDFTVVQPDCELTVEENLREHKKILQRHAGRFEAFAGIDPRWGADGVALFERAVSEWGFRGFKIYPPCGYTASDVALFPFYEVCAQRNLPVMIHTGATSPALRFDTSRPMDLDEAARRFDCVNFILAHAPISYPEECIMMAAFRPNVYLDISGFQKCLGTETGMSDLRRVMDAGIQHKILFGTDWPVFQDYGDLPDTVKAATTGNNPVADRTELQLKLVLAGNIDRLLSKVKAN